MANETVEVKAQIPRAFRPLFEPARYKVFYGGRGGAKSRSFADALLIKGRQTPLRILCGRELQVSIADSVHQLLNDSIHRLKMDDFYTVTKTAIRGAVPDPVLPGEVTSGTEFMFKGLKHNASEVKSTEGIDIAWIEEAQRVSRESWKYLIPTVRKEGSEIWISYNPELESDPTHADFVLNPKPNSIVVRVNYDSNPFFPQVLRDEMEYCKATDYDLYRHVWEGECVTITDAVIYGYRRDAEGNRVPICRVDTFKAPEKQRLFFGADWGFAKDPTTLNRFFVLDDRLFIEYEAHGVGVELDDLPKLFDTVPGARQWPIKADSSRPETISYMRRQGFNIGPADKWEGCVEDGVQHIRGFKEIVIHERCKQTLLETRHYCYKVDRITGEVLPVIVDKNNHHMDALRYGLDGYIQRRGAFSTLVKAVSS